MTQPATSPATESDAPAFDLNMHTARLLMREPFFAALSRRMAGVEAVRLRQHQQVAEL